MPNPLIIKDSSFEKTYLTGFESGFIGCVNSRVEKLVLGANAYIWHVFKWIFKGEERMIRSGIRKVMLFSLIVVLLVAVVGTAHALQGGPDKFGYRYIDSLDKYGPDFYMMVNGEDVVHLDGKSAVPVESLTTAYPIGFPFEFYGKKYNSFYVSGNGYIVFATPGMDYKSYSYSGEAVPSSGAPNHMLAPFWGKNNPAA